MSEMFADLLAVQQEMPKLQKTAINPHFKNKYVPLEDLLEAVIPILNKHNFVLLQCPSMTSAGPSLDYKILHVSGEYHGGNMALCAAKDDPQGQGSAITYARRYSLMSLLGITADLDDDAEATRRVDLRQPVIPRAAERPVAEQDLPLPTCPQGHGSMKYWPAGKSKAGKEISAQYKCMNKGCKNDAGWPESIWADKWLTQVNLARGGNEPAFAGVDPDEDLPFE